MNVKTNYQEFFLYGKSGRLIFQASRGFPYSGFACRLLLFGGAGFYGGSTAYLAFNSGSLLWRNTYRKGQRHDGKPIGLLEKLFKLEIGLTRNANIVPSMSH